MKLHELIAHCINIDDAVSLSLKPADSTISEYLKQNKSIGSKERKFVMELTFFGIRNQILINHLSQCINYNLHTQTKFFVVAILLQSVYDDSGSDLSFDKLYYAIDKSSENNIIQSFQKYFSKDALTTELLNNWKLTIINRVRELNDKIANKCSDSLCLRYSFTKPFYDLLNTRYSYEEITQMFIALSEPADISIRVNTVNTNIDKLFDSLSTSYADGVITKSKLIPNSLNVSGRANLLQSKEFQNGRFDFQDEGSQIISLILDPQEGESILDACAGAGGKTLHIANLMNNKGIIVATDTGQKRLNEILPRAKKAGIKIIETELIRLGSRTQTKYNQKKYDRILIDAPCSGSGTIRRAPFLKYNFSNDKLNELTRRQAGILQHYSKYLKPGGILVYATCSVFPQENSDIAQAFLAANENFEPCPLQETLDKHNIAVSCNTNSSDLTIVPHTYNTDGFYVAKFRKKL